MKESRQNISNIPTKKKKGFVSPKLRDPEGKCGSNQKCGALQQHKEAERFAVHGRNQAARELVSFCFFVRQIESQKSSVTSCSHDRTGTADAFLEVEENFYFIRFHSIFSFFSLLFYCLRRRTSSRSSGGSALRQRSCFHSLSVSGVSTHKRRTRRLR